jgi:hypothetical protein
MTSPLTLDDVGYLPPDLAAVDNDVLRRLDPVAYSAHVGPGRTAAWIGDGSVKRLAVDDGTRATRTAITAARDRFPPATIAGDGVLALAGTGDALADVGFDGTVRSLLGLPGRFTDVAPLVGERRAVIDQTGSRVVVVERAGDVLAARIAFQTREARALRSAAGGRALCVGFEGALEIWLIDGDGARLARRFDGLGDLCDFECCTDETGRYWTRPAWVGMWDGNTGYAVRGIDAAIAGDASIYPAVPTVAIDDLGAPSSQPIPIAPPPESSAPGPATIAKVDASTVRNAYLAAFVRVVQEGRSLTQPDPAIVVLLAGQLPDDLRTMLAAVAWHVPPHLSLGEFWWEKPRLASTKRARGKTASDAIRIGTIANGDEVVARVVGGRTRIVELSHEEDAEIDRGDVGAFLHHCVMWGSDNNHPSSLDRFL